VYAKKRGGGYSLTRYGDVRRVREHINSTNAYKKYKVTDYFDNYTFAESADRTALKGWYLETNKFNVGYNKVSIGLEGKNLRAIPQALFCFADKIYHLDLANNALEDADVRSADMLLFKNLVKQDSFVYLSLFGNKNITEAKLRDVESKLNKELMSADKYVDDPVRQGSGSCAIVMENVKGLLVPSDGYQIWEFNPSFNSCPFTITRSITDGISKFPTTGKVEAHDPWAMQG